MYIFKNGARRFKEINTPAKAYWLGFLYADAYVGKDGKSFELGLQALDASHVEKFKKFLRYTGKVYITTVRARLVFRNKEICSDLSRLGCYPNKSLTLKFPTLEQVPAHLIRHFIRGYVDGDGSISVTKCKMPTLQLIGTKEFLDSLLEYFLLLGAETKLFRVNEKVNTFRLQFCCKNAINILDWLYHDSKIFLDRKKTRYTKLKKYSKLKRKEKRKVLKENIL